MDQDALHRKTTELYDLLGRQLRVRGRDLPARIKNARRLMPRRIRRELLFLAEVNATFANPKLAKLVDAKRVHHAHRTARDWLNEVDPGQRRRDYIWAVAGGIGLAVFVTGGALISVLVWQGLI